MKSNAWMLKKVCLLHGQTRRIRATNAIIERYNTLAQLINGLDTGYNRLVDRWNEQTRIDNTAHRLLNQCFEESKEHATHQRLYNAFRRGFEGIARSDKPDSHEE